MFNYLLSRYLVVSTTQLTIILISVASIFLVFIVIAVLKMYRLKAENKKLMNTNAFKDYEDTDKEFTGHLYDN